MSRETDFERIKELLCAMAQANRFAPIQVMLREIDCIHHDLMGVPNVPDGDACLRCIRGYLQGVNSYQECELQGQKLLVHNEELISGAMNFPDCAFCYLRSIARLGIAIGQGDASQEPGLTQIMAVVDTLLYCSSTSLEAARKSLIRRLYVTQDDLIEALPQVTYPYERGRISLLAG